MNKEQKTVLKASIELLKTTLNTMPSKEADRVVSAVIELLEVIKE